MESADDLVREAGDAVKPIFHSTVMELGLGTEQAGRLMLRIVEAYIKGRADGADTFALQLNRALSADGGVPLAVAVKQVPVRVRGASEERG